MFLPLFSWDTKYVFHCLENHGMQLKAVAVKPYLKKNPKPGLHRWGWVVVAAGIGVTIFVINATTTTTEDRITASNQAAISSNSAVSGDYGNKNVFDLRTGDCFNNRNRNSPDFTRVTTVSCNSAYQYRVVRLVLLSNTSSLPGESRMATIASDRCPLSSDSYLSPSAESWRAGDRTLVCVQERTPF